ncbi:hypothetical protein GSI_09573 [Ganoderma sinense ZZ0214-1]|uniref:Uncharacterized protein n=1 Tax=Ganoderma sinense ZZ0214-1 TaxID=1077348 RepID=A0A2G8S3G1_9APHY|nr:hypothetical protein GSI_09573 [Ganoderma sinense ZZ0214-1]
MSLSASFAQTAMDFALDDVDVSSTSSDVYVTARSAFDPSSSEETDTPYATPRTQSIPPSHPTPSISRLHVPGSFQQSSGSLTPMSVGPTNDIENVLMSELHSGQRTPRACDEDDEMYERESSAEVRRHLDDDSKSVVYQRRNREPTPEDFGSDDLLMDSVENSVEVRRSDDGHDSHAVRPRRDQELTSGGLRREVNYWKEVSKYRQGQNKELKKQYADAVSRWQKMQQQNDATVGKMQEQMSKLMDFMNSSRTAAESELRNKVQAEEVRIAAQHQAIQVAQEQLNAKQAEQDKIAGDLREREAAIEKNRAEVENHQATVSRLLQQARTARPRSSAPPVTAQPLAAPPKPVAPTRATFFHSDTTHRPRSHKAGSSTRMFLTAIPESVDDADKGSGSEGEDDPPRSVPRAATSSRLMASAVGDDVEVHTLTVNQLVEAIRQSLRKEMAESSSRRHRRRSATPASESEPEVDRETRIELLRRVRELYKKQCGIETDKDWHGHQEADRPAVQAYNTRGEGAPSINNIRFDMRTSGSTVSPWNYVIFEHLLETFKANNATFISDNNITDYYINGLIEDKFSRGRQMWRGGQPKLKSTGVFETPEECETRVLLADERLKERARTDQRRRNKFECRHATVEKVIALHVGDTESDVAVWRFLEKVLDLLGPDGMSSEDTCDDLPETVFRVKVLEWRRPMDDHMAIIDNERVLDRDLFSRQGSQPGKRLRDGTLKSTRDPVRRLPQQLYNPDWLKAQNAQQIHTLAVSSEKFDWIRVVATLAHTM